MAIEPVLIFSASNLTNGSGGQAIGQQDTNGVLVGTGPFSTGAGAGVTVDINDLDTGAGGNTDLVFDDGTDTLQVLNQPVTLTYNDGASTVTTTFPAGTQIQAEFRVTFSSGYTVIGLRFENPSAPPDLINAGYAIVDLNNNFVIPPPGTNLGTVLTVEGDGSTPYVDVVCFAAGTLIVTSDGPRPVETLDVGDMVATADHGLQAVTWTGRISVLPNQREHWPIVIPPGLLGNDTALVVSPQHRLEIQHPMAELLFGSHDVLVPAVALLDVPGVRRLRPVVGVTYHHFACAGHELVRANGAWAETLLTGEGILGGAPDILPERTAVRPILRAYEARLLVDCIFGEPLKTERQRQIA
jgi:Hint domain